MSAYMVDKGHVAYLVESIIFRDLSRWPDRREAWHQVAATALGQLLWDENQRSINARYPSTVGNMDSAPGVYATEGYKPYAHPSPFLLEQLPAPEAVQILKAIDCYAYQCCETEDWESSVACAIIGSLREQTMPRVQDYHHARKDAEWGAPTAWEEACAPAQRTGTGEEAGA